MLVQSLLIGHTDERSNRSKLFRRGIEHHPRFAIAQLGSGGLLRCRPHIGEKSQVGLVRIGHGGRWLPGAGVADDVGRQRSVLVGRPEHAEFERLVLVVDSDAVADDVIQRRAVGEARRAADEEVVRPLGQRNTGQESGHAPGVRVPETFCHRRDVDAVEDQHLILEWSERLQNGGQRKVGLTGPRGPEVVLEATTRNEEHQEPLGRHRLGVGALELRCDFQPR